MQIVFTGDNLHEMSYPVLGKNKKNTISLSSAELTQRMVEVKQENFSEKKNWNALPAIFHGKRP